MRTLLSLSFVFSILCFAGEPTPVPTAPPQPDNPLAPPPKAQRAKKAAGDLADSILGSAQDRALVSLNPADEEAWRAETRKLLQEKLTVEFVDTPLTEAVAFLTSKTKANFVIDPHNLDATPVVNLRLVDLPVGRAIEWMCHLTDLKAELRSGAIHIFRPAPLEAHDVTPPVEPSGKLHIKLANNSELDADAGVLTARPELVAEMMGKFLELSDRRIASIPVPAELPALPALVKLLETQAGTDAKVEFHKELNLLVISSKLPRVVNELSELAQMALQASQMAK